MISWIEAAVFAHGASPPALGRIAHALDGCLARVRIVLPPDAENATSLERVDDAHPEPSWLSASAVALGTCEAAALLVVPGDLVEPDPRVVLALCALAPVDGPADAIAARAGAEPALAILRPRVLPEVERRLAGGEHDAASLLASLETRWLPDTMLRVLDPDRGLRPSPATGAGSFERG